MVHLDLNDVLIFGDRPVWTVRAVLYAMHGRLFPETLKIRLPCVFVVNLGIAGIEVVQRCVERACFQIDVDWCVHGRPPAFLGGHSRSGPWTASGPDRHGSRFGIPALWSVR